jgi:arylsulfatase A-like enzyme
MSLPRVLAAALACAVVGGCADETHRVGTGRGVLVIVIDGLRADHVGSFGYDRETTPELDQFARKGVVFEQAFSTAPWLLPTHVSLLTGCDPLVARRVLPPDIPPSLVTLWHVPNDVPHLAHEFLRQGYDTAAFLDHAQTAAIYGFARGFESYFAFEPEKYTGPQDWGVTGVTRRLKQWLAERSSSANWFAYVEVSDLERVWTESDEVWDTYFAPRPELSFVAPVADAARSYFAIPRQRWSGGMRTLGEYEAEYDGAIRRIDQQIGRVLHELEAANRLDHTTVVITSSHGVGFGEAGLILDQGTLTDVDLHVPLIVRPAHGVACARGTRSRAVVSALDVAPTLLSLEGLNVPQDMQGVSLARTLAGAIDASRRYVFARCGYQEGFVAIDERYCFESTSPWRTDDRALVQSWYGGPPLDRKQREILHDRELDLALGHVHSAPLDDLIVAPMRAAAAEWDAQVEILRKRVHADDWLEKVSVEPPTKPGGS